MMSETTIEDVQWPHIQSGGIPTENFLSCCEALVQGIGSLGTVMNQVKNDMNGNVKKLLKVYNTNPENYEYLENMIRSEMQVKNSVAPDALLWLKRALHFVYAMLNNIIETLEDQDEVPEMKSVYLACYNDILRPHHNWAVQKAFTVCINRGYLPEPRKLLIVISKKQHYSADSSVKEIASDVKPFIDGFRSNLEVVIMFCHSEGLDKVATL